MAVRLPLACREHPSLPGAITGATRTLPSQLFVRGGYSVTLYDIMAEQLEGAVLAIGQQLEGLQGEGLLGEGQVGAELLKRVTTSSNLQETVEGAEYVQVRGK